MHHALQIRHYECHYQSKHMHAQSVHLRQQGLQGLYQPHLEMRLCLSLNRKMNQFSN